MPIPPEPPPHDESKTLLSPRLTKVLWQAFAEVLGQQELATLTESTGPSAGAPKTHPQQAVSFSQLALLHHQLEQSYGPAAGRGLALRAGRASFHYGLREFGSDLGLDDLAFRLLPLATKIDTGFKVLCGALNGSFPAAAHWHATPKAFVLEIRACPICWARQSTEPLCHWTVGLIQEALYWLSAGRHFLVRETDCRAAGAPACRFHITRQPFE